jgi:hypothetical protein
LSTRFAAATMAAPSSYPSRDLTWGFDDRTDAFRPNARRRHGRVYSPS